MIVWKGCAQLSYTIIEKDIAPILTVTHLEPCTFQSLSSTVLTLFNDVKKNISGSFLCYMDSYDYKPELAMQIYCPVKTVYEDINDKKHEYKALQRTKVLSTIHTGSYDDLAAPFEAVLTYAKGKEYEIVAPYRVVFHKEKRKWQRKRFFKRALGEYVVEVQVQVVMEEMVLAPQHGGKISPD